MDTRSQLPNEILNLIATHYLPHTSLFKMKLCSRNLFNKESLSLYRVAMTYPEIMTKYRCPSQRHWDKVNLDMIKKEMKASNSNTRNFSLILATRKGDIYRLQSANLTFEEMFSIRDHNGNNLIKLAKICNRQHVLNWFNTLSCAHLHKITTSQQKMAMLLLDKKYNPAFYWQSTDAIHAVFYYAMQNSTHPDVDIKKMFYACAIKIAIKGDKAEIIKSLCDTANVAFSALEMEEFISYAELHKKSAALQILLNLTKTNQDPIFTPLSDRLFRAFINNQKNLVIDMLSWKEINLQNISDFALHCAASCSWPEIVTQLLDQNVNPLALNGNRKPSQFTSCIKTKSILLLAEYKKTTWTNELPSLQFQEAKTAVYQWALNQNSMFSEFASIFNNHPILTQMPGMTEILTIAEQSKNYFLLNNLDLCFDIIQSFIDTIPSELKASNLKPKYKSLGGESRISLDYKIGEQNTCLTYQEKNCPNFHEFIRDVICDFGMLFLIEKYSIDQMLAKKSKGTQWSDAENTFMGHEGIFHHFFIINLHANTMHIDWDKFRETINRLNSIHQKPGDPALKALPDTLTGIEPLPFSLDGYAHKLEKNYLNKANLKA